MHIHFSLKEPKLLTEMIDSGSGAGSRQNESEAACARMQSVTGPRSTGAHMKAPKSQRWNTQVSEKIMNEMVEAR